MVPPGGLTLFPQRSSDGQEGVQVEPQEMGTCYVSDHNSESTFLTVLIYVFLSPQISHCSCFLLSIACIEVESTLVLQPEVVGLNSNLLFRCWAWCILGSECLGLHFPKLYILNIYIFPTELL